MLLNKEEIKKIIPYKEPFLFVDGVEEMSSDSITGFYQTSSTDYYFEGHFVDFKIMPGALIIEALAQLSTILIRKKLGKDHQNYHCLAYSLRSAQFFSPIFPGDKIELKAKVLGIYPLAQSETKIANVKAEALVEGKLKTEARFSVAIVKKEDFKAKFEKKN